MTDYKITVWKESPIHMEVNSLPEALLRFVYAYEEALNKIDLDQKDFELIITKGNGNRETVASHHTDNKRVNGVGC